ncbi:MAG: DUF2202 domain-containing protein [Thermoanaerobaculia bacterium]|nr:DUF2202 domain-containing protein [Thermoanaerobaculia bacterium]
MKKTALAVALLLLSTPLVAQRGPGKGSGNPGAGGPTAAGSPLATYVESLPKEDLGAAEAASIAFLREEEKLARDVYRALFAAHGDRSFANIAAAEQRHMDLVKLLLDRYGLSDPAAGAAPGEFQDARLAALYTELVAKGKVSLVEALKVGATIEDFDLADVAKGLAAADNRDVKTVLQNLAKGSRNHLRAFSRRLEALDASYVAQYLPADEIARIVAAPRERGAFDENGQLLAGTGAGQGRCGRGQGQGQGRGRGKGPGAGGGPGNGTGSGCPNA